MQTSKLEVFIHLINIRFRKSSRNFNPTVCRAAKIAIVEAEEIVPTGTFDPDEVHLPGVFVKRIIKGENYEKKIEVSCIFLSDPDTDSF